MIRAILIYLIIAFIKADWNVLATSESLRATAVFFWGMTFVLPLTMLGIYNDIKSTTIKGPSVKTIILILLI